MHKARVAIFLAFFASPIASVLAASPDPAPTQPSTVPAKFESSGIQLPLPDTPTLKNIGALITSGHALEAKVECDRILASDAYSRTDHIWAYLLRADAHLRLEEHKDVLVDAQRVLDAPRVSPEAKSSALGMRLVAHQSLEDNAGVIEDCTKSLAMNGLPDPIRAVTYISRAKAHENLGEWKKAINDYSDSLSIPKLTDHLLAHAYLGRGRSYEHLGKIQAATADYQRALRLKGIPDELRTAGQGYLNNLQGSPATKGASTDGKPR